VIFKQEGSNCLFSWKRERKKNNVLGKGKKEEGQFKKTRAFKKTLKCRNPGKL